MILELVEIYFNDFYRFIYWIKCEYLYKRLFFLTLLLFPFTLLSQSLFESKIEPFLLEIDTATEIRPLNFDSLKFYIYNQIPDLSKLSVDDRKQQFINLILPSILIEKSKIKTAYNYVVNNFNNIYPNKLTQPLYDYCNCITTEELLLCLTEQPNSIILAQAAIESGWGTSRFFLEGFNLFGIHSFNKHDNRIKASSSSKKVYVKKYIDISSSVSDYLRTLAKGNSYLEYRKQRLNFSNVNNLIQYLTKYSERRELYVKDLALIIDYNNLTQYDTIQIKW